LIGYVVLIGGTPIGELNGWIQATNGALTLGLVGVWLRRVPRDADVVDIAILLALLLFLATAVLSLLPRQSFSAATQAMALAAAFYLARRELVGERRSDVQALLGWTCLVVVAVTLPIWVGIWIKWLNAAGWSQPPPLNVWLPPGMFDNRHYVGTLVLLLAPGLWGQAFRRRWRVLAVIGTIGAGFVILMDASRTLVAAAIIALVIVGLTQAPTLPARVRRNLALSGLASLVVLVLGILAAAPSIWARISNLPNLLTRFGLWGNAIEVWLKHPVTGVGPGAYPFSYFLTDYFRHSDYSPRHPDNAVIQLLAESGVLGVIAVTIVAFTVGWAARGMWRSNPAAVWALIAFIVASLGTNPTDFLFLVVPALVWAALLVPAVKRPLLGQCRPSIPAFQRVIGVAFVPVAAAVLLTAGASATYQVARDQYAAGNAAGAERMLEVAVALDPSEAIYWRELGGLHLAFDDAKSAHADFQRALRLVPFDPGSMRGLSLAVLALGDLHASLALAEEALRKQPYSTASAIVVAITARRANEVGISETTLTRALIQVPWFGLVPWTNTVLSPIDPKSVFLAASQVAGNYSSFETGVGPVLVVLMAGAGDADAAADAAAPSAIHSARALAAVTTCDKVAAEREISLSGRLERGNVAFWFATPVVSQAFPQSEAFGPELVAIYLGFDARPGPLTNSLLADGVEDSLRYRRIALDIRTPMTSMPGLFRGTWLFVNDPTSALSGIGTRLPACRAAH
jgi:O-antigen ligase